MKIYYFVVIPTVCLLFFLPPCVAQPQNGSAASEGRRISTGEFIRSPFGFALTIENFEKRYGNTLKRQRYFTRNENNSAQTDTILKYYKGKTKVFFFKLGHAKYDGALIGAVIRTPAIELNNGIKTGMTKQEFFGKFSDWQYEESDTLILDLPYTSYTYNFVFKRNKLKLIKISPVMRRSSGETTE